MEHLIQIIMPQPLPTDQQVPQATNIGCVASIQSGYANYSRSSTTNDSNALIDVLENVIIIDPSTQD